METTSTTPSGTTDDMEVVMRIGTAVSVDHQAWTPERIAEPGIRAADAFTVICFPTLGVVLGYPLATSLSAVLGIVVVAAGAAVTCWFLPRALRTALLDEGDVLVVRDCRNTVTLGWDEVVRFADGALLMGEAGAGWVLRVDTRDGRSVCVRATYWKRAGRPETVGRLNALAALHGVDAQLTGAPGTTLPGGAPVEDGWAPDPMDPTRERAAAAGIWSPYFRPVAATPVAGAAAGDTWVWWPLPQWSLTAIDAGRIARATHRRAELVLVTAAALAAGTALWFSELASQPQPDYTGASLLFFVGVLPAAGSGFSRLGAARSWDRVSRMATTAEWEGRNGQHWQLRPRAHPVARRTSATLLVLMSALVCLAVLGHDGFPADGSGTGTGRLPELALCGAVVAVGLIGLLHRPYVLTRTDSPSPTIASTSEACGQAVSGPSNPQDSESSSSVTVDVSRNLTGEAREALWSALQAQRSRLR